MNPWSIARRRLVARKLMQHASRIRAINPVQSSTFAKIPRPEDEEVYATLARTADSIERKARELLLISNP